jgi:hypothetical protein
MFQLSGRLWLPWNVNCTARLTIKDQIDDDSHYLKILVNLSYLMIQKCLHSLLMIILISESLLFIISATSASAANLFSTLVEPTNTNKCDTEHQRSAGT